MPRGFMCDGECDTFYPDPTRVAASFEFRPLDAEGKSLPTITAVLCEACAPAEAARLRGLADVDPFAAPDEDTIPFEAATTDEVGEP